MLFKQCILFVSRDNHFYATVRCCSTKTLPLIVCKRREFNYNGEGYKKKREIPLACSNWDNKKSKGDYFTIRPRFAEQSNTTKTFKDLGLVSEIENALSQTPIQTPTKIQTTAIPSILAGKNSIVAAETGCGKTLAYLLPVLQQLFMWKLHNDLTALNSPRALIICPNRELACQIADVAEPLCDSLSLDIKCLIGGQMKQKMKYSKFEHVDIIVTSFGAISKMVSHGIFKTDKLNYVILDEADTLLDDSFNEKLSYFLKKINFQYQSTCPPIGTQLILASATMPKNLPDVLSTFIDIESLNKVTTDSLHMIPNVKQTFSRLGKSQKPLELLKLVRSDFNKRIPTMIFSNKAETCNWISLFLNENGIDSINLNSKMPREMKISQFQLYQTGKANIISCTDIGSRGLDTTRTRHIINYDFPFYIADYIHRCGRTNRMGSPKDCSVSNFVAYTHEIKLVQKIEKSVRELKQLSSVDGNTTKLFNIHMNAVMQ